jgi:para-nitrobenzyl esterase
LNDRKSASQEVGVQRGIQAACVLAGVGVALGLCMPAHADALTVKTEEGKVHGKTINGAKVRAFLGMPYAAPPVGNLRWRAPQPPAMWKGVRDATHFGAHCMQLSLPNDDTILQDSGPSEDCLFLNVYTPADATAKSKLPVMFWIHGGGYLVGSSSEPRFNGDFLPAHGVVLVTINYRLSAFGFLATADLAREAGGAAGNYGLLDMVAALQWVKGNIGKFGGNPANVTVFGESVGSVAVSILMASHLAQGLFQKAIGESGSALGAGLPGTDTLAAREKKDEKWVASLGASTLAELRALPAQTILKASDGKQFWQDIDGKLLTEPVAGIYAAGMQAHVPLLAGWTRDEDSSLANGMTAAKWKVYAAIHFHEQAAEFLALYPGDTDAQAARSAADYGSDAFIAFGTWSWIEAHRKTGNSSVFRYHFELAAPPSKFHPGWFAFHGDDLEYVFGTLDTRPDSVWRPEDRTLSERMMSYWTNFARTGNPNGPGLPVWPEDDEDESVIHLDSSITSGLDALRPRYEFLMKRMPNPF